METTKSFSIKRLLLMLQKDVFDNFKYVLIGYGSIIGLFTFIFMVALMQGIAIQSFDKFYTVGLTLIGIFIAGMAFNDFRVKEKSMSYLTLPASLFEKFLSMLLLTTIGVALSFTVVFYVFNGLAFLIGTLLFNTEPGILNIFNEEILYSVLSVFGIQSVFLAGAVSFKKAPLFLTLLALFIVGLVLLIYSGILSFIAFHDLATSTQGSGTFNMVFNTNSLESEPSTLDFVGKVLKISLVPLFWLIAFLKLKEKEV